MRMHKRAFHVCFVLLASTAGAATNTSDQRTGASQASKSERKKEQNISNTTYADLMKPIDIYAAPSGAKKLISLEELYSTVQAKGLALKVSRETYNTTAQQIKTENDKKIPILSFDASHDQKWSKVKGDSDPLDNYSDRDAVSGSRNLNSTAGLSLSGTPVQGVTYKLQFPQLVHSHQTPESSTSEPPRHDSAAFSSTLAVSLLKDNPIYAEGLTQRKSRLTLASARETFRYDVLRKLAEAEGSYFGLVQNYLQLLVQERSLKLARALEAEVKEKIAAGESSSLEATRAELQTAQAEVEFMSSQINYESAIGEFRNSLAFSEEEGTGVFPDPKAIDIDVERLAVPKDAATIIEKSNPEIGIARLARDLAETELESARKSTLPSLAFNMSYGNTTPGEGWGQTTFEALKPNDRAFTVGLTYSQILFNDPSRNSLRQAVVGKQKAEFSADETMRRIQKDFNSLLKKLDIGIKRHRIAKISREIAEKKLNSEYEKFKAGESSVRNVIDTQTEVNAARISEISARIGMLTDHSQLRTLLGKLPEGVSISIEK